ncbi:hypothetical protein, conserved [Plasmodium gonderi]|uniref:Uncharacterized protein n=1 Tax=Plasmodium gonderi TaxID=77519 RepID=A0A1Y1JK16_PLAGO|nr:hypothetical protein, conserved [Plasmodium gonderi]GAW80394.1 hypothetical protein, conserved [Plasmodium gonderi]
MHGKKKNTSFDILPPPLERISKPDKKNTKEDEKNNLSNQLNLNLSKTNNHTKTKANKQEDTFQKDEMDNMNKKIKNNTNYISEKYSNVILNSEEISSIMNSNSDFKSLIENDKVSAFMNDYLANPLVAISKYHKDETISKFLDSLFQYMNAKSTNIHLNNLEDHFTVSRS